MTAVMSATDALRRDRIMASLDDNQLNYASSSVDWRQKYNEVADMLAETRAELDDFHHSSKELEEELERELERTEKAQQDLKIKVARAETERDEWKSKFMSLQTTHNTTTTSLQRELDKLRQEHQVLEAQFRELEIGNDDLERNERAVTSSLADVEAKYSRALEEKILLEHELLDKANIEEEFQRLKDELRDANVEMVVLKEQLAAAQSSTPTTVDSSNAPSSLFGYKTPLHSEDNLLSTPPPPDLQLFDLEEPVVTHTPRPQERSGPAAELHSAGFQPKGITPPGSFRSRPSALPSLQTRMPAPPVPRLAASTSQSTGIPVPATTSRNKGVQMVSEMRARVRNLEQKLHTRVPRLRMGSTSSSTRPAVVKPVPKSIEDVLKPRSSLDNLSPERSKEKRKGTNTASDSSGWVLIMEDSPSPVKNKMSDAEKDKERRRASSPTLGTSYRPRSSASSVSTSSPVHDALSLYNSTTGSTSGIRKPQSRHSAASTASSSSIPTPNSTNASRPQTPTHSMLSTPAYSSTSSVSGLKRSTTSISQTNMQLKRSSMGSSTATERGRDRLTSMGPPPLPRPSGTPTSKIPTSNSTPEHDLDRDISPPSFAQSTNVTMRPPSKLPSPSIFSKSRIGKPSSSTSSSRRNSDILTTGYSDAEKDDEGKEKGRVRSGTASSVFGFRSSLGGR